MRRFTLLFMIHCTVFGGWIDRDTTIDVNSTRSFVNGRKYSLVFSDEFNTDGRSFSDGNDPRWTAIDKNDYTNYALHYYNPDLVSTSNGHLNISTIVKDVTYTVVELGHSRKESKTYQSAMVQGWNKFCFTGGIVEISAKLPGRHDVGGLWPAMWMLGNLARATYVSSSNNMWPWSYDTCNEELQHQQLISKCNTVNHFELHSRQGRGAPEVDILEAMPGVETLVNTPVHKPYFSSSFQVSPGIETYRPNPAEVPQMDLWYNHGLEYGPNTSLNVFFYGMHLAGEVQKESYLADAVSANTNLSATHFDDFHTYRLEWQPGGEGVGYLKWYLDDVFLYSIEAGALNITGAIIPEEPMYLILNTAVSSTWGFPTPCPEGCACNCFDCRKWECLCAIPYGMCENLPADFLVDWVRVYQDERDENQIVGCSTVSHPTKTFIEANAAAYMTAGASAPLKSVHSGGGSCTLDSDCGAEGDGLCVRRKCKCTSSQVTGPLCKAPSGFDDIIWDVTPSLRMYHMFIPPSLIVLITLGALTFACVVVFKYIQQRQDKGLTALPCLKKRDAGGSYVSVATDNARPTSRTLELEMVESAAGQGVVYQQ